MQWWWIVLAVWAVVAVAVGVWIGKALDNAEVQERRRRGSRQTTGS